MPRPRNHTFYDQTISLCTTCLRRVEAKIVLRDDAVWMLKRCPEHGREEVLIADDIDYYRNARERFIKPGEMPLRFNTPTRFGCPYDCGLCPDHEQHSCVSIVEITERCNLRCPVCFAGSGPERGEFRSVAQVESMLDAVVRNEGEPDVVQISGGEPTIHPELFAILDAAKARPIRHLMLNTNGIRLAKDPEFAERLAGYAPGFEIYLQCDSLLAAPLIELRGVDLRDVHDRSLQRCDELRLPVTLVATIKKGLNDSELGDLITLGSCVRGVTFQPVQEAGRVEGFEAGRDRLTLTEVRRKILEQSDVFRPQDLLPVPCHPDAIAMGYALRKGDQVVPLSGDVPLELLLDGPRSTISFETDDALRSAVFALFSTAEHGESAASSLKQVLCCTPKVEAPDDLLYEHLFRVVIMEFADARGFDLRSVKKSCVHIVSPEGHLVPFDTYNLLYREPEQRAQLERLRQAEGGARALPLAPPEHQKR